MPRLFTAIPIMDSISSSYLLVRWNMPLSAVENRYHENFHTIELLIPGSTSFDFQTSTLRFGNVVCVS